MALIDFDKFLASFITEMKECSQMRTFSIPLCIKKALIVQGLDYKNGEIVKVQRRVSAEAKETGYGESEDEKIKKVLIDYFNRYKEQEECGINTFYGIPTDNILAWLEKQKPIDKIQLGKKYKCIASPRYTTFMIGEIYKPEDKFLCSLMNFCYDCFEPIDFV